MISVTYSIQWYKWSRREGSTGTISVKFCVEVKGWLKYKMAKKYCRKFQPS